MKKKFGAILTLFCLGATCLVAGCSSKTELEKYQERGYTVMVTYDANGGSFLSRQGVTVMDLFKPADYEKDEDGVVHIQLLEPTDLSRPTSGTGNVTLTKQEHFFAGWYQNRDLRTNADGRVVTEDGDVLEEVDGTYFYEGTETEATPAYTYSGYWDFETDTIDYKQSDGLFEMTLYAAWVPYYQFDYYYRVEGETKWEYVSSSSFDYKTTNANNSATHDKDTIWVPEWENGAMNYIHRYENNSAYEFPKINGTTFKSAYSDAECTQKIDTTFEHKGTLDLEKGQAVNRVQNIYIEVEKGERFKIDSAKRFAEYANLNGIYEIMSDLDFSEVRWPNSFTLGQFNGKIYSVGEEVYSFKNISAKVSSTSVKGGLFGTLGETAVIENVAFENVTVDLAYASTRESEAKFAFFAGYIDEKATVTNVSVGGTFRLGEVALALSKDYELNLLANGVMDGIIVKPIALEIYGKAIPGGYQYSFSPSNVVIDDTTWKITLDYSKTNKENRIENESITIGTFEK